MAKNTPANTDPAQQDRFDKLMASLASVWHDKLDVSTRLVDAGIDLSLRDDKGRTPLHVLADIYTGHGYDLETAKMLMAKGASIEAQTPDGGTVLHSAVASWLRSNQPGMVMLLLESGANIDTKNAQGKTAFDLALEKRASEPEKKSLRDFFEKYSSHSREKAAQAAQEAKQPSIAAQREQILAEKARRAPRLGRKPAP